MVARSSSFFSCPAHLIVQLVVHLIVQLVVHLVVQFVVQFVVPLDIKELSGTQHFNLIACSPRASGLSVKRLIISMMHGDTCCQMQQASPLNQLCVITLGAACLSTCRLVCLPALRYGQKKCPNPGHPSKSASLGQEKCPNPGRPRNIQGEMQSSGTQHFNLIACSPGASGLLVK